MRGFCTLGVVLLLVAAPSSAADSKLEIYEELIALAGQIDALRAQGGDGMAPLVDRYRALSVILGGDDPGGVLGGGTSSAAFGTRAAPMPPPGGSATTTSDTNNTPVVIVDNTTVTSTITVSGADSYLLDVDLTVDITHTFASDLEITLESPAGTVTTITTDNGGANDNVYVGTLFDDFAAETVTDFTYTNLVPTGPLIPEGAMAAFVGEDPNGTWTLSIFDDAGGDTGTLNSWTLDVASLVTPLVAGPTNSANNTPVAIVDNTTVTSTIAASGMDSYLCDVDLTVDISHTFASDLEITLESPAGTVTTITTDNGGANDDVYVGTVFDDFAAETVTDFVYTNLVPTGPLVPEGAMGAFIGEDPNGTWTLSIFDDAGGDTGTLNSWSLDVTTCTAAAPVPPVIEVPTVDRSGLTLLVLLLAGAGIWVVRRSS